MNDCISISGLHVLAPPAILLAAGGADFVVLPSRYCRQGLVFCSVCGSNLSVTDVVCYVTASLCCQRFQLCAVGLGAFYL